MNARSILLAYATRYGSTQEVAETIAAELRQVGFEVDVRPMSEVADLGNADAVVLGAALYNSRWHPDAHRFLVQHQQALGQRPVAIFALGPLAAGEGAMRRSRRQLDGELQKYPWLKPAALEMFVGKYDSSKQGFFGRLMPASDNRDWDAIRSWAAKLPALLRYAEVFSQA